jgi:hypothetical protein
MGWDNMVGDANAPFISKTAIEAIIKEIKGE